MDDFLPVFQQTLRKNGIKGAVALCKEEKGLIPSRLFVAGLEAADQGAAAMRRSMANETELEILPRLHFLLAPILAIAKIATMVGLFFTVISMINTFNAIGEQIGVRQGEGDRRARVEDRPRPLRHRARPVHGHPARLQPRAVQGVDRALRGEDQGRRRRSSSRSSPTTRRTRSCSTRSLDLDEDEDEDEGRGEGRRDRG